jgi:hypothetical protein
LLEGFSDFVVNLAGYAFCLSVLAESGVSVYTDSYALFLVQPVV